MSAPFPNIQVNDTVQLLGYVNTNLMDGFFGIGVLITLWVIAFVRLKLYNDNIGAFAGASFFLALIGVFMWSLDLVNNYGLVISILMVTIAGLMLVTSKKQFE